MLDPHVQQMLVELFATVIALVIVVTINYVNKLLRAHLSQAQMEFVMSVTQVAVGAVEQLAAAGKIELPKYDEALKIAKDFAAKYGMHLTDEQWRTVIESAVAALRSAGEELKQTAPAA